MLVLSVYEPREKMGTENQWKWMRRLWTQASVQKREESSPFLPSDSGITESTWGPLSGTGGNNKVLISQSSIFCDRAEEEREEESTGGGKQEHSYWL